jgi:hypothetical protein
MKGISFTLYRIGGNISKSIDIGGMIMAEG